MVCNNLSCNDLHLGGHKTGGGKDGNTFKIGEVLTPNQMIQRVRTVANASGVPDMASEKLYGDSRKLVILLQDIYHLKRNNKKVDGEKPMFTSSKGL